MAGLFRVILHSDRVGYIGNEFINVFGYKSFLTLTDEEQNLSAAFISQVLPAIKNIVSVAQNFSRVEVQNVTNGTGYYDQLLIPTQAGARAGEQLPQFNAWGFKYNRKNIGERSGGKRFGVVSESDQNDGFPLSAMLTILNTTAGVLGAPILVGMVDTWFPVILHKPEPVTYPWSSHDIAAVTFSQLTSQVSRKL